MEYPERYSHQNSSELNQRFGEIIAHGYGLTENSEGCGICRETDIYKQVQRLGQAITAELFIAQHVTFDDGGLREVRGVDRTQNMVHIAETESGIREDVEVSRFLRSVREQF